MPTVLCICKECSNRFYAKDTYVPMSKNYTKIEKEIKTPKTWEQWIIHSMMYCEDCRLKAIPSSCIKDYDKIKSN